MFCKAKQWPYSVRLGIIHRKLTNKTKHELYPPTQCMCTFGLARGTHTNHYPNK